VTFTEAERDFWRRLIADTIQKEEAAMGLDPMERICGTCGRRYGSHFGTRCYFDKARTERWTLKEEQMASAKRVAQPHKRTVVEQVSYVPQPDRFALDLSHDEAFMLRDYMRGLYGTHYQNIYNALDAALSPKADSGAAQCGQGGPVTSYPPTAAEAQKQQSDLQKVVAEKLAYYKGW
jgi:hypothetical protein